METIKNVFLTMVRTFLCLMILLIGWGYVAPALVSAANTGWVFLGLFMIPFVPFLAWVVWKILFRKVKNVQNL